MLWGVLCYYYSSDLFGHHLLSIYQSNLCSVVCLFVLDCRWLTSVQTIFREKVLVK